MLNGSPPKCSEPHPVRTSSELQVATLFWDESLKTFSPLTVLTSRFWVGPCSPCGPGGPWAPVAPVSPFSPLSPWGPWAPVSPLSPLSPFSPFGPADPVAPASPFSLFYPFSTGGPCGPGSPLFLFGPWKKFNPWSSPNPGSPLKPIEKDCAHWTCAIERKPVESTNTNNIDIVNLPYEFMYSFHLSQCEHIGVHIKNLLNNCESSRMF